MKKFLLTVLSCLVFTAGINATAYCRESEKNQEANSSGYADMQLRIASLEKALDEMQTNHSIDSARDSIWNLSFGGRVFNDWAFPEGDDSLEKKTGQLKSKSEFRKARLVMQGKAPADLGFKFEINFTNGDADLTDVYLTFPGFEGTTLTVGQQKEAFSMENMGSSKETPFMERAPVSETLNPKRNIGLSLSSDKPAPAPGYWLGYFHNADSVGISDNHGGGHTISSRFTLQPVFKNDGEQLLHLGLSYNHRTYGTSQPDFKLRTSSHLLPAFGNTGKIAARSADILGWQTMHVSGPFGATAEATYNRLDLDNGTKADLEGGYVSLFYYLTGETHKFDKKRRAPGQVKPKKAFSKWRGGAWMLACRYDYLDLVDDSVAINGGKLKEWTFGLNWILNQNQRIMFNYINAENQGTGSARVFQTRFQTHF